MLEGQEPDKVSSAFPAQALFLAEVPLFVQGLGGGGGWTGKSNIKYWLLYLENEDIQFQLSMDENTRIKP